MRPYVKPLSDTVAFMAMAVESCLTDCYSWETAYSSVSGWKEDQPNQKE